MAGLVVLDASVLIAYLKRSDEHHARARGAVSEARDSNLAASTMTFAEVLVAPARANRLAAVRTVLNRLEVGEVPFPGDAAARLATIRARSGLKLPDCCVLLAAEDAGAESILTFDANLAAAARAAGFGTAS